MVYADMDLDDRSIQNKEYNYCIYPQYEHIGYNHQSSLTFTDNSNLVDFLENFANASIKDNSLPRVKKRKRTSQN